MHRGYQNDSFSEDSFDSDDYSYSDSEDSLESDQYSHYYSPHARHREPVDRRRKDLYDQRRRGKHATYYSDDSSDYDYHERRRHPSRYQNHLPSFENPEEVPHVPVSFDHKVRDMVLLNLMTTGEDVEMPQVVEAWNLDHVEETPAALKTEGGATDMDELYKEVQKELHTRFKNMFEDEMLLPNLEFNPEFEGKLAANLLSLNDIEEEDE